MENNLQGGGGEDLLAVEKNLYKVGVLGPATPAKPSLARPEFLLSIEGGPFFQRCMQNFDAEYGIGNGFEDGGVNYTSPAAVQFGDLGSSGVNGCVIGTDTETWRRRSSIQEDLRRNQNYDGVENGEMLVGDSMHGVNPNSNHQGSNGIKFTNPLASSHGGDGGITETVSGNGSGRKRKKSETDVKRKPRVREKKHRPKIFDVMKPKKVPKPTQKKPKSEKEEEKKKKKKKDTTEKKKIKEAKKPKCAKKRRKKQKTLDSGNAILESSCVSDPQTPEQSEKNHRFLNSSEEYGREASVCNKALDYDLGYDGDDAAHHNYNVNNTLLSLRKSPEEEPQLKVYTRQKRRGKKMDFDFDLNFNIQESDFCAQLMSIVRGVKCKKKRKRRQRADAYPPVLENTENLRKILPTFKQYCLAIMEPRHFRCVLFLKPMLPPKKKRSKAVAAISGNAKLLPLYREIRKSPFIRYLPLHIPRRKRSVTKRRHDLPISTSDFGSNLNEINRSKKIPPTDLNVLRGTPEEEEEEEDEVFCVDNKSSMITPIEVVEPLKTQIQVHLPYNDGFHGRLISMLHHNDGKHELMIKTAEENSLIPRAVNYLLECSVVDLIRKMYDLSISDNCKQIVMHDQSSHGELVPVKGRTRKKKGPEPPKVIPDADAMKTWILLKEDGREKTEENYWKEQKEIFCGRVQMFIRCMHLIQGNRRFSRWKGSVVDSVIGVFLTQNVSDNMSSDAFMRFVARFPKHFDTPNRVSCLEGVTHSDTPNRDVRDEDETLQNPAASSLEGVTHSERPNGGVRDKDESLIHPVAPSFEGIAYSGTPNKGVREEGETPKSPMVPSFEGVTQNTDALNKYDVFPLTSEEATMINSKRKKTISKLPKKEPESQQNWEELRKEYDTISKDATCDIEDSVDWDAVRRASTHDVAETVGKRGMKNVLARIIKKFLDRLEEDHGKIDLEWLRNVPTEKVREYLLSFERIGLKSLDCVRLLTLHHHAFPVDTNVGRIVVRLGWVPLQPLPQGVEIHLLNDYPILAAIQEYLWPRLNALDQQTLYELHYQMITFGKVFCTKKKPRCNVCPMSRSCKHFASAQSAQLRLPSAQDKANEVSNRHITLSEEGIRAYHDRPVASMEMSRIPDNLPSINEYQNDELGHESQNCEPIIEIPGSPETNSLEIPEIDIEDLSWDSNRNSEEELFWDLTQSARESNLTSEALVLLAPEATSFPVRKLKNARRLHTEHEVYVLPDDHQLLAQFRKRESDDPVNYLLAIWISDTGNQQDDQTVPGTILIPCRTANRGRFALNGTYFQVNEVFADYETSVNPISVPRSLLWNLPRRIIYCAPSGRSIFRDMSLLEIHNCFWNGYICVRSFDRRSREPSGLHGRFHLPKDLQKSSADNKRETNSVNNNNSKKKKKKKVEPEPTER